LLPPAEVSKKAKIFEKETMVSLGAAVLLSTVMLCLLVLTQSLAIFDEYNSVLSIFFMLLIGSPFLLILKMRLPGLIRAQESSNLNRLLLIVILGKATILIYPSEGYSTLAAGLITSGSYLVACLYLLLQFMRRSTRNDSSSH
jgi:O-antigen/teichoic acid export membrane protein